MSIITQRKDSRLAFFIDNQNIRFSTPDVVHREGYMIDYVALVEELAGGRIVQSARVFDTSPRGRETAYHDCLRHYGFIVETRDCIDEANTQKEIDVLLGCRLVEQALLDTYDVAVVVSGDRDFVPAIEMARARGKQVEVACFADSFSAKLQRSADRVHLLDRLPITAPRPNAEPEASGGEEYVIAEEMTA